jgi:hypothetical protein
MSIRKLFLRIVIGSITISALAAILCLLSGHFSDFDFKVICTSLLVAGGSILTMSCGAAWETRRNPLLAGLGFAATAVAIGLSLLLLWQVLHETEWKVQALAIAWILAVACAHSCLLSLARLTGPGLTVGIVAQVSILTLAAQLIEMVFHDWHGEPNWRAIGINTVVVAAASVLVPIVHKMMPAPEVESEMPAAGSMHLQCPRCGQQGRGALGVQTCGGCGQGYRVELL